MGIRGGEVGRGSGGTLESNRHIPTKERSRADLLGDRRPG